MIGLLPIRASQITIAASLFLSLGAEHLALFGARSASLHLALHLGAFSASRLRLNHYLLCANYCLEVVFCFVAAERFPCFEALQHVKFLRSNIDEPSERCELFVALSAHTTRPVEGDVT